MQLEVCLRRNRKEIQHYHGGRRLHMPQDLPVLRWHIEICNYRGLGCCTSMYTTCSQTRPTFRRSRWRMRYFIWVRDRPRGEQDLAEPSCVDIKCSWSACPWNWVAMRHALGKKSAGDRSHSVRLVHNWLPLLDMALLVDLCMKTPIWGDWQCFERLLFRGSWSAKEEEWDEASTMAVTHRGSVIGIMSKARLRWYRGASENNNRLLKQRPWCHEVKQTAAGSATLEDLPPPPKSVGTHPPTRGPCGNRWLWHGQSLGCFHPWSFADAKRETFGEPWAILLGRLAVHQPRWFKAAHQRLFGLTHKGIRAGRHHKAALRRQSDQQADGMFSRLRPK